MPTTSNFGWTTPADTDLVKDGAAAIRTLGNGIDTSLVDLKGGTTGQNLRKASNTDLDFTFAGDATNTVIDAEGDLLVGDSADTLQRLAIGTTGQVLTVDTTLDGKIKWAAASGATIDTFGVNKTSAQTITANTATKITFDNEQWDTGNHFASSTFTASETGYWQFSVAIRMYQDTSANNYIRVYKNGSWLYTIGALTASTDNYNCGAFIVSLAANDTVELYGWMEGTNPTVNGSTTVQAIFQGHKIK